jgi:hypothetical protein
MASCSWCKREVTYTGFDDGGSKYWCDNCKSGLDASEVMPGQPDPKDRRIAELEAAGQAWVELHNRQYREMEAERDQLHARVQELERERDAYKRAKEENDERFMIERDEARAECERLKAICSRRTELAERVDAHNQSLEAQAARMRESWKLVEEWAAIDLFPEHHPLRAVKRVLAETDAGALGLAVIEAAREWLVGGISSRKLREAVDAWDRGGRGRDGDGTSQD